MIYAMPATYLDLSCVVICEGNEPFPAEAAWPVIAGLAGTDMVIESGVLREKTIEEKQAYADAVAADAVRQSTGLRTRS